MRLPTVISFMADWKSGEVALEPSLTEYKWVSYEEAKGYDLIEGILDELRLAERFLKTGSMKEWTRES